MATDKIRRLNYIGSKFQLLDWLTETIKEKTGLPTFQGKWIADLFGGTGIVSYHFRSLGAAVISNDAELFSSIIVRAFTLSVYTEQCKQILAMLNEELKTKSKAGYITKHYSPYETNERMFFTKENAQKIDYVRSRVEELKPSITDDEYSFLLASLIVSADMVGNVPAVYGCYLKNFKERAKKSFEMFPIHMNTTPPKPTSQSYNNDILSVDFLKSIKADIVYLDPPYNERQYSKNYFPLNMIAKTPTQLETEQPLKGKTGIPQDCFLSPFCKKGELVESSFHTVFKYLNAKWIFVSYNTESLISKEKMLQIMGKYGTASVVEREQKRFKSFEYNEDKEIKEYLFCLEKNV